jgi:predicted nucleic-acid-binding Zn-ribbon protein
MEQIENVDNKYVDGVELETAEPVVYLPKKGLLMCECACGNKTRMSDEVIQDGLSWSMIIGNDHYLTLSCKECGSSLKMYIKEITTEDELPKESNQE